MRRRIPLLVALALTLAACDTLLPTDSAGSPDLLIGNSPLRPLLANELKAELAFQFDPVTAEVTRVIRIEVLANPNLFEEPVDPRLNFRTRLAFRTEAGEAVGSIDPKDNPVAGVDPRDGGDHLALVVIAMPVPRDLWTKLQTHERVTLGARVEVVGIAEDGREKVFDEVEQTYLFLIGGSPLLLSPRGLVPPVGLYPSGGSAFVASAFEIWRPVALRGGGQNPFHVRTTVRFTRNGEEIANVDPKDTGMPIADPRGSGACGVDPRDGGQPLPDLAVSSVCITDPKVDGEPAPDPGGNTGIIDPKIENLPVRRGLVVIATPVDGAAWKAVTEAMQVGPVEVEVVTELVMETRSGAAVVVELLRAKA